MVVQVEKAQQGGSTLYAGECGYECRRYEIAWMKLLFEGYLPPEARMTITVQCPIDADAECYISRAESY